MATVVTTELPASLIARSPPERRGLSRDRVRLLVLDRHTGATTHTRFDRIGQFLRAGDLLVVNASSTLPAVLQGRDADGKLVAEVRLARHRSDGGWSALLLPRSPLTAGLKLYLGDDLTATLTEPDADIPPLWSLRLSHEGADLMERLHRLGQPVRYEYAAEPWPLADYQTMFAREPGSAEMPSAGRAFTWQLLFQLKRQGVEFASLVHHAGLSSTLDDAVDALHFVGEEEYHISPATAAAVEGTRRRGGRVVAVGTTVVRALESAAEGGRVRSGSGRTRLRITSEHRLGVVDGLLTGLHEPEASHLDMLRAFVPDDVLRAAYAEAVERGYLWHEFGDLNLIA